MKVEILPCPFCGGTAYLSGLMEFCVECSSCHCQTIRTTVTNAISLWNARRVITANAENLKEETENGYFGLPEVSNENKPGRA